MHRALALRHASTRSEISSKNRLTFRGYLSGRFVRDPHKHGVVLWYQRLFVKVNLKTVLTSTSMESTGEIEARRQRLLEKAKRSNDKSNRLQHKIQREVQKRTPKMSKIMKWQEKSVKYVNRGLRYMNEFDAQGEDNREQTEISFNLEKVCVYNFGQKKINVSTLLGGANGK